MILVVEEEVRVMEPQGMGDIRVIKVEVAHNFSELTREEEDIKVVEISEGINGKLEMTMEGTIKIGEDIEEEIENDSLMIDSLKYCFLSTFTSPFIISLQVDIGV